MNRAFSLLICAAFRTTSTEALEIEASLPPLHLKIAQIKTQYAICFSRLPSSSPVIQRLGNNWRKGKKAKFPPPLPPKRFNGSAVDNKRTTPLMELEKLTSPSHERVRPFHSPPWRKTALSYPDRVHIRPHPTSDEDPLGTHKSLLDEIKYSVKNLIAYSDGSHKYYQGFPRTGAAAVIYHQDQEIKTRQMGLGGNSEIYDAEMAGLMMAAKTTCKHAKRQNTINHIFLFADNTSAVSAIFDPKPAPGQIYAIKAHHHLTRFLDANPENQVTIAWCPGHQNIRGNKRADKLAKEARNRSCEAPNSYSLSRAQRKAKATTGILWRKEWRSTPKLGGYATANRIPPSTSPTNAFSRTPREVFGRLIQCRTNHNYTGEYRRRFLPLEEFACPCGEEIQTREHIIVHCNLLHDHKRHDLRKISQYLWLPDILGTKEGIAALIKFLHDTPAFTRDGHHPKKPPLPTFEHEPEDVEDPEPADELLT